MYSVIVAEDEPLALKSICSIIERHCPDFKVVCTAENGKDAAKAIREIKPDLVISDIKMPRPTGVELAEIFREELPDVCFIIISGFQDFEFTQSAIRSGVTDYLLKPITPGIVKNSVEKAAERIRVIRYHARNTMLRSMGRGESVPEYELKRYFPDESYYICITRKGGLPRRFYFDRNREIYSDINESFIVFGRDEMESLYMIPEEILGSKKAFLDYVEKLSDDLSDVSYKTVVYNSKPFKVDRILENVQSIYRNFDKLSVIGKSRIIDIADLNEKELCDDDYDDCDMIIDEVGGYAQQRRLAEIKECLRRTAKKWDIDGKNQLWVEYFVREMFVLLRRYKLIEVSIGEAEYLMGDVFFNAGNLEELMEGIIDILPESAEEGVIEKVDSKESFDMIDQFLKANISTSYSLQEISDRFNISQVYMSRIFRKYTSVSYNKYMTSLRIDRAKELMTNDPTLFIKDVAIMVGYPDQFYFSRIFRSYTGRSPSEYLKEAEQ
ncbi:MAG: response regulator [Lachnospiraceae bacterium]|nr:response regulator [Lachnospiraceae bacterium]